MDYCALLLCTASDEELMTTTRAAYSGRVEMRVDLAVIDVPDTMSGRRSMKRAFRASRFDREITRTCKMLK